MGLNHKLEDLVNIPNLEEWMDINLPEVGDEPLRVELFHGGYSNAILQLNRGGEDVILRRPPAVAPPGSERTVLREAKLLSALKGTSVPHPKCFVSCDNADVIGAPFYIMEKVKGWSGRIIDQKAHNAPPFDRAPFDYRVPFAIVDGLVELANVDYESVGLSDFGTPENFLERQVDRWSNQLHSYKEKYNYSGRELPGYDLIENWLRNNIPKSSKPGIIHGDVGTTNMVFAFDAPARLVAMIDWELSTIGDPLIDMGWFCSGLRDERNPGVIPKSVHQNENWPTLQELARYYSSGTGRCVDEFDYYMVLARFKAGCIMEYKVAQSENGTLDKQTGQFFSKIVFDTFSAAENLVRKIS